jgi:type I restriction enzyme S subunit
VAKNFPLVPLGEVAVPVERPEIPTPGTTYRQIGVRLWGEGVYERESIDGGQTKYKTLSRVEANDILVNKIWARNGSVAVVSESLAGCYGSNEFPTFAPVRERLEPRWFHWLTKTSGFWEQCDEKSRGTSGKNRIRPERFLEIQIPLPPLSEQQRIVARIEELSAKIEEVRRLQNETATLRRQLLLSVYAQLTEDVEYRSMAEAAPLKRRPVRVDLSDDYRELGIRSFGKGTFHKPTVSGAVLGTKKIFRIEAGDLLFNIVFAWKGTVAVAKPEDHGRVGSHRFLTCVPKEDFATSSFLCFHFLTERGLQQLGEASPGGAGRNRTLGLKALEEIRVPVPPCDKQIWFDALQKKLDGVNRLQSETAAELDALLPSVLDKAFKGEL